MRRFLILAAMLATAVLRLRRAGRCGQLPGAVASGDVTSSRAILWLTRDAADNYKVEGWTNSSLSGPKAFKGKFKTDASHATTPSRSTSPGCSRARSTGSSFKQGRWTSAPTSARSRPLPLRATASNVNLGYTGDADGTQAGHRRPGVQQLRDAGRVERGEPGRSGSSTATRSTRTRASVRPARPRRCPSTGRRTTMNQSYPNLKNLLASTSTYATMDDHEVMNDYDATTVNPAQYAAGRQAFLEAIPSARRACRTTRRAPATRSTGSSSGAPRSRCSCSTMRSCRTADVPAIACCGDLGPTLPTAVRTTFPFSLFLPPTPASGLPRSDQQPEPDAARPGAEGAVQGGPAELDGQVQVRSSARTRSSSSTCSPTTAGRATRPSGTRS